jgi:tetratricopeptide (TPR) repeat protein
MKMKRLVLMMALCFVVGLTFAQKKNIKAAKSEVNTDKPNFKEARNLIDAALKDAESKDLPETWFTAGWIENKQFDEENKKQILNKKPDHKVMYNALFKIKPYFEKADELEQIPNEKGKIKVKYRKDMRAILKVNYPNLINGGAYYFEQKDYGKAFDFFEQYIVTPDMKMFADEPLISKTDTNYLKIKFYAALSASQIPDHKKAAAIYEELKTLDYDPKEIYQYLAFEYNTLKDTANFIRILREGADKFPGDSYYLLNLINQYIYTNQKDAAVDYLIKAIEQNPQDSQLYSVLGSLYEEKSEVEKAKECFDKALSLNPESAEIQASVGRIHFNRGVALRAEANEISDQKKYTEALKISNDKFKEALPYFEKAHRIKPEEKDYLVALKGIYYNLGMGKEYDKVEAQLNKLGQ